MGDVAQRFLDELGRELPLPDDERNEAIEEISAHIQAATDDLVASGVTLEDAELRITGRFGTPARLADDLAAARRGGLRLLPAMGALLRTSLGTTLWTVVTCWVAILLATLVVGSLLTLARRVIDFEPNLSWSGPQNSLLSAAVYALAAFAVGRALVPALAVALRRRAHLVRPYVAVAGIGLTAYIGLAGIRGSFDLAGALLQASLPAWFALGTLRPQVLPAWLPPGNVKGLGAILLLIAVLVAMPLGLLAGASGSYPSPYASDPLPARQDPARIAPFVPRVGELFSGGDAGWGSDRPSRTRSWELARPGLLAGWTDLHVEIWLGLGPDNMGGFAVLDPNVDHALARFPVTRSGTTTLTAEYRMPLVPGHSHYVVALLGTSPAGERMQLDYASDDLETWSGTAWEFFTAPRP